MDLASGDAFLVPFKGQGGGLSNLLSKALRCPGVLECSHIAASENKM